ncbi:MAG: nucleoside 2-deoxyribosyltransferase [Alphaproteobacteria bacterium]|nr:nucleoside 2-deoxyribosyltransferase [Alphaproteobacteria bacterium]
MRPRIYLAGPEVFLRDAAMVGARKKAICAEAGLDGVFPLDQGPLPEGLSRAARAIEIARRNEALIRGCQGVIANMTPFRGPSADVGTAYEMGFARALGLPVLAYSNDGRGFFVRTAAQFGGPARLARRADGDAEDPEGLSLEDFDLTDNLMLDGAVVLSGGAIETEAMAHLPAAGRIAALDSFARCVRALAARLRAG